ncbi:MAG: hypothetical protein IBJ12_11480 [Sphingomonadaceae bacterium]|nr:hypothetical protein [Sphingomonadaceae bacterium]
MPIYCDESGGVGRGVMTLAALSITESDAGAIVGRFRDVTGLRGELKGSRIDLAERALLFELLEPGNWHATVGIAISALRPDPGQDRGDHDIAVYSALLDDVVGSMVDARPDCSDVIIDDGRYGIETLKLVRNAIGRLVGPLGTASLAMSHILPGLQLADVIANSFFNRALVNDRQARMAAIVAPFLESGKITLRLLSADAERDDQGDE